MYNYMLAGVGGQGTVLSSRILAEMFMSAGYIVRTTETIGMAQRGGSVTSHLRASKNEVYSPLLPEGSADLILGYEISEIIRNSKYINDETVMLVSKSIIKPITNTLSNDDYEFENMAESLNEISDKVHIYDFSKVFELTGTEKVLNICMIGAAIGLGVMPFAIEDARESIKTVLPERIREVNISALEHGYRLGTK